MSRLDVDALSFTERFCLAAVLLGLSRQGAKTMPVRLTHPTWETARERATGLLDADGHLTEEAWSVVQQVAFDPELPELHQLMLADLMESGLAI